MEAVVADSAIIFGIILSEIVEQHFPAAEACLGVGHGLHQQLPSDLLADLPGGVGDEADWDGDERSILRKMADEVKIGIQNGTVEITVSKRFSAVK